jgi:uncharacterized membrane protein YbhN (UPF0104 family)
VAAVAALHRLSGSFLVRLAVTVALLVGVGFVIDWGAAARRIADGSPAWFAAAVAAAFAALVIGALRWGILLRASGVDAPRRAVLRAYFSGVFANNFLPSGFGGDAVRAWLISSSRSSLGRALTSVFADRATALLCVFPVGYAAQVLPGYVPPRVFGLFVWCSVACGAGLLLAILVVMRGESAIRRLPAAVVGPAHAVRRILHSYGRSRKMAFVLLGLGCAFQTVMLISAWAVSRSISLDVPFTLIVLVAPLVTILTVLPISVAGFGVREGGYIALLAPAGVSSTAASVFSLMTVVTLALASLPGALALATSSGWARRAATGIEESRGTTGAA